MAMFLMPALIANTFLVLTAFQLVVGTKNSDPQAFFDQGGNFSLFDDSSTTGNSTSIDVSTMPTYTCPNTSNYFSNNFENTFPNPAPRLQADYGDKDIVMKLCVKTVDNSNINLISPAFKVIGKAFSDSGLTTPLGDGAIVLTDDPTYAVNTDTEYLESSLATTTAPLNLASPNATIFLRWTFAAMPAITPMPFFGVRIDPVDDPA